MRKTRKRSQKSLEYIFRIIVMIMP